MNVQLLNRDLLESNILEYLEKSLLTEDSHQDGSPKKHLFLPQKENKVISSDHFINAAFLTFSASSIVE